MAPPTMLPTPYPADGDVTLAAADIARIERLRGRARSAATERAYASDWARFTAWCRARRAAPLPASPLLVAAYLAEAADTVGTDGGWSYTPATLRRWTSAINHHHSSAGAIAPGSAAAVRDTLAAIRREHSIAPRRRSPLLLAELRLILGGLDTVTWPGVCAARRDAALLLAGFAGALRRSELSALDTADVSFHRSDGIHLRIRRSKTDQDGEGTVRALPFGADPLTCAPCALRRWIEVLDAADAGGRVALLRVLAGIADPSGRHVCRARQAPNTTTGQALFRPVRHGLPGRARLSGAAVDDIVRRRASLAGLDGDFGGHSLRAGFVTEAFRSGADAHAIMRQTGHRSVAMLEVYAREHAPLVGNAVTGLGL